MPRRHVARGHGQSRCGAPWWTLPRGGSCRLWRAEDETHAARVRREPGCAPHQRGRGGAQAGPARAREPAYRALHGQGRLRRGDRVSLALTEPSRQSRWQVLPYIDNMGAALAAADLVLSRAGASSIAEIAALAVPSVLVPYPLATADHQTTNARFWWMLAPRRARARRRSRTGLPDAAARLVDDSPKRDDMREAARGLEQARPPRPCRPGGARPEVRAGCEGAREQLGPRDRSSDVYD